MSLVNFKPENVEFVSYTGKGPNLCSGILTLKIHGKEHRFGCGSGEYPRFWASGGWCGFPNGFGSAPTISEGPWVIDSDELPSEFKPLAPEIDEVFTAMFRSVAAEAVFEGG